MSENLKVISFNIRGLGNQRKRKKVFDWLKKGNYNIIMLQEAHSTQDDETNWSKLFPGHFVFSHEHLQVEGLLQLSEMLSL